MTHTLTATQTHRIPGGAPHVHHWTYPPGQGETYDGMRRRLRDAGRDHRHGPGWVEYDSSHHAQGASWTSTTRLEWT